MTCNFYRDNEQKLPTAGNFLFIDYYREMREGQLVTNDKTGKVYRVMTQCTNSVRMELDVFLLELNLN